MASPAPKIRRLLGAVTALRDEVAGQTLPTEGEAAVLAQVPRPDVLAGAFPASRSFILDRAPRKFALTTRRAAKTYSVGLDFINDSYDYPFATYLFIALTRADAKQKFWKDVLKRIDREYNLGAKFNKSELMMTMPNGAEIRILGMDADEEQREKLLGGKYRKVCVDEAASFSTDLRKMLETYLEPALADLRGQLIMTGTPGDLYAGYFREVTNGCDASHLSDPEEREPGWSGHVWTTEQNPYMAVQWKEQTDRLIAENPRIVETAGFKQMRRGEWVVEESALCYRYSASRNTFDALPVYSGGDWHFGLAMDLGYEDPSAFVLMCWHDWDPVLYFVRSWKQWHMDITSVARRAKKFEEEVRRETGQDIEYFVIDGSAKQTVAEMRKRHNLPLIAADKQQKEHFIELMNDEFILGNIKLNLSGCSGGILNSGKKSDRLSLAAEYLGLIWDPKFPHQGLRREQAGLANHLTDCGLYGWRFALQYLATKPAPKPEPYTSEWFKKEEERMRDLAEEEMRNRKDLDEDGEGLPDSSNWDPAILDS